ncbi:MAG TPA: SDR family oxidoreductase [Bryobacteraceae bacterium]|nr:SDR family oxidoreductase [Bryobacteraceae bacterium]
MPRALEGAFAVVTGAGRGLGKEIARALVAGGATVLLAGRSAERMARVCSELGGRTAYAAVDLECADAAERLMARARELSPRLDVLVNNAAIQGPIGALWENATGEWQRTIRVNLMAPVELCRLAVPWMAEGGGGSIVNLAGGGATSARPRFSAYATAKAGLVRFTETLAHEAAAMNVRVNCVSPGAMSTDMLREILAAGAEQAGERECEAAAAGVERGEATVRRAAELVALLASPAAAGITGRLISAVWDAWAALPERAAELAESDIYTLRRILPEDRGKRWE